MAAWSRTQIHVCDTTNSRRGCKDGWAQAHDEHKDIEKKVDIFTFWMVF